MILFSILTVSCFDKSKPNYQFFPNMYESVGYSTYQESDAFSNGIEAQIPVEGSIPRGWVPYEYSDTNEGYESAKVNLIPFNPFPESQYKTSSPSTIDKFQDVLFKAGIRTTTRRTRGDDVDAACGQLAGKVLDKSRRNAERNRLLS